MYCEVCSRLGDGIEAAQTTLENEMQIGELGILLVWSDGEACDDPITAAAQFKSDHPDWLLYALDIRNGTPNPQMVTIGNSIGDGYFQIEEPGDFETVLDLMLNFQI